MGQFSENPGPGHTDIATYGLNQRRGQPSENRAHYVIAKPMQQGFVIKFILQQQFFYQWLLSRPGVAEAVLKIPL